MQLVTVSEIPSKPATSSLVAGKVAGASIVAAVSGIVHVGKLWNSGLVSGGIA
jgi:hypothetical protein